MTRPPGLFFCLFVCLFVFVFFETKVERKWCTKSKMHREGWGLETRPQNADTCVPKEPKYRGLDDCGCTLNTDYIWLHKSSSSEKIDPHVDQKQEINFVCLREFSTSQIAFQVTSLTQQVQPVRVWKNRKNKTSFTRCCFCIQRFFFF